MSGGRRGLRRGEHGIVRGCCFGVVLVVVLAALGAFIGVRALAAPDLGAAPGGTSHGDTEALIAATLAGDAATHLVLADHVVEVLSERDLTVITRARNPSPDRYRNPQTRIRDGDLVVSADTSVGPFGMTAVARFTLALVTSAASTQIAVNAVDYAVGQLGIPGFLGDRLDPRSSSTLNLTTLFASNTALLALSRTLDCLAVRPDGVHLGFHRPGALASSSCG